MVGPLRNGAPPPEGFYSRDGAFVNPHGTPTIPDPEEDHTTEPLALASGRVAPTGTGMA